MRIGLNEMKKNYRCVKGFDADIVLWKKNGGRERERERERKRERERGRASERERERVSEKYMRQSKGECRAFFFNNYYLNLPY